MIQFNGIIFKESEYDGYLVSQCGNVLSQKAKAAKILKNVLRSNGKYLCVCIRNGNAQSNKDVHRLVASVWVSGRDSLNNQVNHKDGNKMNNHSDNLEWTTPSKNTLHAHRTGLANIRNRVPVLDTQTGVYYDSILQMGQMLGFSESSARRRLAKKTRYTT